LQLALLAGLVLQVPFFPDHTDQCGPSVVASVLSFWGTPVTPLELKREIYTAHLKGSLAVDLLLSAQKHDFKAHLYEGSVDDLKAELAKGHPVIAFLNRGYDFLPVGHYVVIIGFDDERQGLVIHSGTQKNKFISYKRFSGFWDKTQRSTLLILPPERDQESAHGGA
jgi:ABC-type bacteriocin/lantibiotic exporter with double-glycine peptidase domain